MKIKELLADALTYADLEEEAYALTFTRDDKGNVIGKEMMPIDRFNFVNGAFEINITVVSTEKLKDKPQGKTTEQNNIRREATGHEVRTDMSTHIPTQKVKP
jgi:hypothetical protein